VAKLFLFFITRPYFLLLPAYLTTVLLLSNTYHISFRDLKTCYWVSVNNTLQRYDRWLFTVVQSQIVVFCVTTLFSPVSVWLSENTRVGRTRRWKECT